MQNRDAWREDVDQLVHGFPTFLRAFEANQPFKRYGQWEYHKETISRRRAIGSVEKAIHDDVFLNSLYKTLKAWGIGIRASKLKPYDQFVSIIRRHAADLEQLDGLSINDSQLDIESVRGKIWHLIDNMRLIDNNAPIVAMSKTLHHLLPDLVVPIDRGYTQKFFRWQNPTFQYGQEACFQQAFDAFADIARRVEPSKYVNDG